VLLLLLLLFAFTGWVDFVVVDATTDDVVTIALLDFANAFDDDDVDDDDDDETDDDDFCRSTLFGSDDVNDALSCINTSRMSNRHFLRV
jgi:hypothetical protein